MKRQVLAMQEVRSVISVFVLFLISTQLFGQDQKEIELQNHWYAKAQEELINKNISAAFTAYYFAYEMVPNNELGKKTLKLSDSLKTLLRKELISNLVGNWKIKIFGRIKTEDDREHYNRLGKLMKVTYDSIFFFKNKKNLKSNIFLSTQKITFCNLNTMFPIYSDIIHSNKEIWNYHINENKNKLTITENGELISPRNRTEVISHPSGFTYNRIK